MQRVGKSKVAKLKAKAGIVYPLIRLPKTYADGIGKTAEIFETKQPFDENRKLKAEGEIRTRVVASTGPLFEYKPHLISVDSFEGAGNLASSPSRGGMRSSSAHSHYSLATLELQYVKNELTSYTDFRKAGLSERSKPWMNKASQIFWNTTNGKISKASIEPLRNCVLARYTDVFAKRKVLNFAKAFLRYLAKTRFDTRYKEFDLFLEMPKAVKERKRITQRIVTIDDIKNVLSAIKKGERREFTARQCKNYTALVLFGAYTGQRPSATIRKLTVGQFRAALRLDPPVLDVLPQQDKIRMQHYVPLHPCVVDAVTPLLNGRNRKDDTRIFAHEYFDKWARRKKIPLVHGGHFVCGDLRKVAVQHGDIIQWDQSNRAFIMTHGVSGIDWKHYKHPLPEHVYQVYMQYWADVRFALTEC